MKRGAVSLVVWLSAGRAGAEAIVVARVSPQVVEVGDTVTLLVEATTDEDTRVASPAPGKTKPFRIVGRSGPTPLSQTIVANGQMDRRQGLSMSYSLQATKEGTFTIGPASADIGGIVLRSAPVKIKVVKVGMAPKRSFDPFSMFGDDDPFGSLRPAREEMPTADASLALSKAEAPYVFYRFGARKLKAVVGELISVPVYEYEEPNAPRMAADAITDPKAPDFVIRLFEGNTKDLGLTRVGAETWKVALVRRWVLAPLRAGRAIISSFRVRLRIGGQQLMRETGPLVIEVTDPPISGRPPGYEVGTVGQFALSAQIAPRNVDQGGVVTLSIELSGSGNFPSKLTMPSQDGVEYSESEIKDNLKLDDHGRFGGSRRFTSVIRISRAGKVVLGKVYLPFFNAEDGTYKVAEVDLGSVEVTGVPALATSSVPPSEAQSKLASLPSQRASLEGAPPRHGSSISGFGALAFSGPVILGLSGLFVRGRRWSRERGQRASTPAGRLAAALAGLAEARTQSALADGAMTRVVETAIEAYLGITARGLSSDALRAALEAADAPAKIVSDAVSIVCAIETARFMPGEGSIEEQKKRIDQVETLVAELKRAKR